MLAVSEQTAPTGPLFYPTWKSRFPVPKDMAEVNKGSVKFHMLQAAAQHLFHYVYCQLPFLVF